MFKIISATTLLLISFVCLLNAQNYTYDLYLDYTGTISNPYQYCFAKGDSLILYNAIPDNGSLALWRFSIGPNGQTSANTNFLNIPDFAGLELIYSKFGNKILLYNYNQLEGDIAVLENDSLILHVKQNTSQVYLWNDYLVYADTSLTLQNIYSQEITILPISIYNGEFYYHSNFVALGNEYLICDTPIGSGTNFTRSVVNNQLGIHSYMCQNNHIDNCLYVLYIPDNSFVTSLNQDYFIQAYNMIVRFKVYLHWYVENNTLFSTVFAVSGIEGASINIGNFFGFADNYIGYIQYWNFEEDVVFYFQLNNHTFVPQQVNFSGEGVYWVEQNRNKRMIYQNNDTSNRLLLSDINLNMLDTLEIDNSLHFDRKIASNNYLYCFSSNNLVIANYDSTLTASDPINKPVPKTWIFNAPNPFQQETTLKYSLGTNEDVILSVFNVKGQRIKQMHLTSQNKESNSLVWNGEDTYGKSLPNGVYLIKIQSKNQSVQKKVMLLK